MTSVDRRSGIEIIDRAECLALLDAEVVGRIAVVHHGTPVVLPVNYAMDGHDVVFRTGPGTKLAAAEHGTACFEIDGFDREAHTGWSVLVTGRLEEVTSHQHDAFERLQASRVSPWIPEGRDHWMRVVPGWISGRRLR
jgi:nitroimidazol reductase NimA-like FMN-containing flavoprotein (pyridoxamine 5'-phosphate oxidase superfamily)